MDELLIMAFIQMLGEKPLSVRGIWLKKAGDALAFSIMMSTLNGTLRGSISLSDKISLTYANTCLS